MVEFLKLLIQPITMKWRCNMKNEILKTSPIHSQIKDTNWDSIVVSISGGKDSCALLWWALENFPKEKLVAVHSIIDIDWDETLPIVKKQCEFFGIELITVQAIDKHGNTKGFLDQLTSPRVNRKTGKIGQYKFPDMGNRWCTSVLKTGPIDKYCRSLHGNILCLIGERREESSNRAKLEAVRPDTKNSKNGRTVVKYSPILDLTEKQVWALLEVENIPVHPCYKLGVKRASCAICIFSSDREIAIAATHAPHIVKKYIEAENKIEHSFKYKPATKKRGVIKKTIADILREQGIELERKSV